MKNSKISLICPEISRYQEDMSLNACNFQNLSDNQVTLDTVKVGHFPLKTAKVDNFLRGTVWPDIAKSVKDGLKSFFLIADSDTSENP